MVRPLTPWVRGGLWLGFTGWLLTAMLAVWAVSRHDHRVAMGFEVWIVPLAVGVVVFSIGLAIHGVLAALAVRAPSTAATAMAAPALAVVAMIPPAWTSPEPGRPPVLPTSIRDVVLVTLDTFRADHLGVLGGRAPTPALDALAAQGVVFTDVVTPTPLTAPAHASMFTGRSPAEHGLIENGRALDPDVGPTIAESLRSSWRTGAFVSSLVVDRRTGLDRGFDHYDDRFAWSQRLAILPLVALLAGPGPIRRSGDVTVARALRWMQSDYEPAFCWIHLYDPHAPYQPPRPFKPVVRDPHHAASQRLMYQGAIAWTDSLVGRIVNAVHPDTAVIVVGDHGESLGEHGYWFNHGGTLYEPSVHVPLIVRWPGQVQPGTVRQELTSVSAVFDLVRQGALVEDPFTLMPADGEPTVDLYTTGQQQRGKRPPAAGVRKPDTKLVSHGGDPEYFDLSADPGELSASPPPEGSEADVARIEGVLATPPEPLDEAEQQWLRVLGYVE